MTNQQINKRPDEMKNWIPLVIIFTSGFFNSYSFLLHNGAFATMQTGNLIHTMIRWSKGQFLEGMEYLTIIATFLAFTFLGKLALDFVFHGEEKGWRKAILVYQLFTVLVVGFLGASLPHVVANSVITSGTALQYCAFRRDERYGVYATIFCTGNMRSFVDQVYDSLVKKEPEASKKAFFYGGLLLCFALGVVAGSLGVHYMGDSGVLPLAIVFLFLLFGMK